MTFLRTTTISGRNAHDAFHGFFLNELNTHLLAISVSPCEDPTESYNIISPESPKAFSFEPGTVDDVILSVALKKLQKF